MDDYYATAKNAKLVVSGSGVVANDTHAAGDVLSAMLVSKPTAGKLTLDASGAFVYTPNKKFSGIDSFTYKVSDGAASDTATVWIKVGSKAIPPTHNARPEAEGDSYTTAKNTKLKVGGSGLLANDTDADGNPLSAVLVSKPAHGKVTLSANGTFVYTPSKKFIGQDSFKYKLSDGWSFSDVAVVTVQVGKSPAGIDLSNDQILPPHPTNALSHHGSNRDLIDKFQALFDSDAHTSHDWASMHSGVDNTHASAVDDHNLLGMHDAHLLLR